MVKLITTIKNRVNHFIQVFPSLITQYGIDYSIYIVDFFSDDGFNEELYKQINDRKIMFSKNLLSISLISITEPIKFNPRKARNLGAFFARQDLENKDSIFAFTDIDTFIGMDYLNYWSAKTICGKSFVATRIQDNMATLPKRILPEINYGNCLISEKDFFEINGFEEAIGSWGGDDDDLFHRLKLKGLQEINPYDAVEAKQYSILHGDELRVLLMENPNRVDKEIQKKNFDTIYTNRKIQSKENNFLFGNVQVNIYKKELYKRE